ncbi:MAG: hypothetical protein Q6L68_05520 [Thermostichus sp. DG02_5_bins_236]
MAIEAEATAPLVGCSSGFVGSVADVGGSPSPFPGIPAGGVVILNGEQIDSVPLTVGQILSLQARATDSTGNDNSEQIEWRDAEVEWLCAGRGSDSERAKGDGAGQLRLEADLRRVD